MSAQKFGGEYSPDEQIDQNGAARQPRPKKWDRPIHRSHLAANLLFFVPLPLLLDGFSKMTDAEPIAMLTSFGAFGILTLSAWILREGLKAEEAYAARKIAKPPLFPRKIFASVLTGLGVAASAKFGWGKEFLTAVVFGGMATASHLAAFGIDPLRKKGMAGIDAFESERVAKVVEKAEETIKQMQTAAAGIGSRQIEARVDNLITAARDIMRRIEDDPRDLTRARKFMTIYLTGAKDATVKFANLYRQDKSPQARDEYVSLMDDLEHSFNARHDSLLLDDKSDLDIEIEVLRDRLNQEGLKARI